MKVAEICLSSLLSPPSHLEQSGLTVSVTVVVTVVRPGLRVLLQQRPQGVSSVQHLHTISRFSWGGFWAKTPYLVFTRKCAVILRVFSEKFCLFGGNVLTPERGIYKPLG